MHRIFMAILGGVVGFLLFALGGYYSGAADATDHFYWVAIAGAFGGVLTGSVIASATENE